MTTPTTAALRPRSRAQPAELSLKIANRTDTSALTAPDPTTGSRYPRSRARSRLHIIIIRPAAAGRSSSFHARNRERPRSLSARPVQSRKTTSVVAPFDQDAIKRPSTVKRTNNFVFNWLPADCRRSKMVEKPLGSFYRTPLFLRLRSCESIRRRRRVGRKNGE